MAKTLYGHRLARRKTISPQPILADSLSGFMQKPSFFLLLAAFFGLALFWNVEKDKHRQLEAQLAATEKAMAAAIAEKNETLAQIQNEIARQQAEDKQLELESRWLELENKRIEIQQRSVDANEEIAMRQIESQAEMHSRDRGLNAKMVDAEVRQTDAQTNVITQSWALEARQRQFRYDRQVANERYDIMRETALLQKYLEERHNGEDMITKSNPGLGHYVDLRPK